MRLKRLTLENFRGFESLDLKLHPQLTVLVGVNGSGKTSILDALMFAIAACLVDEDGVTVSPADYRKPMKHAEIGIEIIPADGAEAARFVFRFDGPEATVRPAASNPHAASIRWTAICAYPVRRQVGPVTTEASSHRSSALEAWKDEYDFSWFFSWFIAAEDLENEKRRDVPDHRDPELEAVRQAVERVMPGYSALRVRRSPRRQPSLTLVKDGKELDLQQLSEGERALAVLAGDIARAAHALGQPAIVLIDEIDLHLHPKWQANVLPSLLRTFPELQFIVTTHSPIVLSHVDAECVRLLENFRLVDVPPTRGRDPNSVLTEVFGLPLRPAETQAQIDHIAELIDEERLDEAKQELHRLGAQLGTSDLEVTRLRGLVELMEA